MSSSDTILVLNAGSSSLKFSLYREDGEDLTPIYHGQIAGIGRSPVFSAEDAAGDPVEENLLSGSEDSHEAALERLLDWLAGKLNGKMPRAAGHRVVHGGPRHDQALRLSRETLDELHGLSPLAPLHQPHNLAPIEALWRLQPNLPQVACFDTAFHRSQPEIAQRFALPRALTDEGVRRYGFHGLSYDYIAGVLPDYLEARDRKRVIVAHLGHGASMCAMLDGRSIATTMGFTALDGLPMSERSGNLDPGVVLYLMQQKNMSADEISDLLYHHSGLKGVSGGISSNMADLLASDAPEAEEAVALFCYRASREIGSLAAALGGLDALVFTAGIGENAPEVRRRIAEQAQWLGLRIDDEANTDNADDISAVNSRVHVMVIPTDEEIVIAGQTQSLC